MGLTGWLDPNIDPDDLPNNRKYIFNVGMTPSGGPGTNTPYIPDDKEYVSPPPLPFHTALIT